MRARAAYISSVGTGGIIVASALLMLTLVSALVAFHSWPGGHTASETLSVPLTPSSSAATAERATTANPPASATHTRAATPARAHSRRHAARVSTAGVVKIQTSGIGTGGNVFGIVKRAPGLGGTPLPPALYPPPSTGPQTPQSTPGQRPAPKQQGHYDPGPTGALQTLPEPQLPGGAGDTAVGVVESLPLPGGGASTVLPVDRVGDALDRTDAALASR